MELQTVLITGNFDKIRRHVNNINRYANVEYVNQDVNYIYFKINNGYTSEMSKRELAKCNDSVDFHYKAKQIIEDYRI